VTVHHRVAIVSTLSGLGYGLVATAIFRWPWATWSGALFVFALAGFGAGEFMLGFDLFEEIPALLSSLVFTFAITGLCAAITCVASGRAAMVAILWLWFVVSGIGVWLLWPIVVINVVVIGRIVRGRSPLSQVQ
jgi:hypothetical protein